MDDRVGAEGLGQQPGALVLAAGVDRDDVVGRHRLRREPVEYGGQPAGTVMADQHGGHPAGRAGLSAGDVRRALLVHGGPPYGLSAQPTNRRLAAD